MTLARARNRGNVATLKPNLAAHRATTCAGEWESVGAACSLFDGPEWRIKRITNRGRRAGVGDIVVSVIGRRLAGEGTEYEIIIDAPDTPVITPTEARKLGNALLAAADAADR